MSFRLIINADDFGWDAPATAAILDLATHGSLTSTTVLANWSSEADLAALSQIKHLISIGYHLNLIDGPPVAPAAAVPSLLGPDGHFRPARQQWLRYLAGRLRPNEIDIELKAQIGRLRDHHLPLSHADAHQHLHLYPLLGPVLTAALGRLGIRRLRRWTSQPSYGHRGRILNAFSYLSAGGLRGFATPDALVADFSAAQAATLPLFAQGLARARRHGPTIEFMSHPGLADKPGSYLARRAEYEFWRNGEWREYLREQGGQLTRFDEV